MPEARYEIRMCHREMRNNALTLIPTGEPTSGTHCFRAKYLGILFYVKNLQKIAKGQEFCSL